MRSSLMSSTLSRVTDVTSKKRGMLTLRRALASVTGVCDTEQLHSRGRSQVRFSAHISLDVTVNCGPSAPFFFS